MQEYNEAMKELTKALDVILESQRIALDRLSVLKESMIREIIGRKSEQEELKKDWVDVSPEGSV